MDSPAGRCDARAARALAGSFVCGLCCAVVVWTLTLHDPVPEPYFGLGEERGAAPRDADPPAENEMVAAVPAQPPERLAMVGAAGLPAQAAAAAAVSRTSADVPEPEGEAEPPPQRSEPTPDLQILKERVESVDRSGSATPPAENAAAVPPAALKALVDRVQTREEIASPDSPPAVQPSAPPPTARPSRPVEPVAQATPREAMPVVTATRPPVAAATAPVAGPAAAAPGSSLAPPLAPLPDAAWLDPDAANWSDAPAATGSVEDAIRRRGRLFVPGAAAASPLGGRLLERLGNERKPRAAAADDVATHAWSVPTRLYEQLDQLADLAASRAIKSEPVASWAADTRTAVATLVAETALDDPAAAPRLVELGDAVTVGMSRADGASDPLLASQTRRVALALARRVTVWRALVALAAERTGGQQAVPGRDVGLQLTASLFETHARRLLEAIEAFEAQPDPALAAAVRGTATRIRTGRSPAAAAVGKAIDDHYLAPNVRIAVHAAFIERMLPEATVSSGPMQDYILGRRVRGTRTVEQTTGVRFTPDADEIRFELLVSGEVDSRTVTEAGPVEIHSLGEASFVVRKPIAVSTTGLVFGTALGMAENDSRLATIQTNFDSVPIMGSIVRNIARSQHDDSKQEATREVNARIIARACREVDAQAEPRLNEMAERIRERFWNPLVGLGLEPRAMALETTETLATARLRLAAETQLAAHTPRPRTPPDALLSLQVHESTINNAVERLELSGRTTGLEDLIVTVSDRIGVEPKIPDELPEDVAVTFAAEQPLRVECRDGLVHVTVVLDTLESGRRSWHDIVAHVAYRLTGTGPQVFLEREGPVQLSGPGHQGRMEIALRTIFGKIFPKERPIALLPQSISDNPRLASFRAVQAVSSDGWFGIALADEPQTARQPAAAQATPARPRLRLRR